MTQATVPGDLSQSKKIEVDKGSMAVKLYYSDCILQTTTASLMNQTEDCVTEDVPYTSDVLRSYKMPYSATLMRRALKGLPASVRISLYHLERLRDHLYGVENNQPNVTEDSFKQHVVDVVQTYPEKMRPIVRKSIEALEEMEINEHTFPECVTMATRIAEAWYEGVNVKE